MNFQVGWEGSSGATIFTILPQNIAVAVILAASSSSAVITGLCHLSSVLIPGYDCVFVVSELVQAASNEWSGT